MKTEKIIIINRATATFLLNFYSFPTSIYIAPDKFILCSFETKLLREEDMGGIKPVSTFSIFNE